MLNLKRNKLNELQLEGIRKRLDFLNEYDASGRTPYILDEGMFDKDMTGWINIGYIKNASPYEGQGDAYLMVNPNYQQTDDISTFKYRATGYNTKPDGTGRECTIPVYMTQYLKIYDKYKDTYYGELFLGKAKNEDDEKKHQLFMSRLEMADGKVVLKHDSSVRIEDGVIKNGKKNSWSSNNDIGWYFWASKEMGRDPSNGGQYKYYCLVDRNEIYDFENDMERFGQLRQVFEKYSYVAQYWEGTTAIVVNTFKPTPISYIRDNHTGKIYDGNWNELQMN